MTPSSNKREEEHICKSGFRAWPHFLERDFESAPLSDRQEQICVLLRCRACGLIIGAQIAHEWSLGVDGGPRQTLELLLDSTERRSSATTAAAIWTQKERRLISHLTRCGRRWYVEARRRAHQLLLFVITQSRLCHGHRGGRASVSTLHLRSLRLG